MREISIIIKCFKSLNERFYEIRYNTCTREKEFQESRINEIVYCGIYGCDPEDVIDFINEAEETIKEITAEVDNILIKKEFDPYNDLIYPNPFDPKEFDKAPTSIYVDKRANVKIKLLTELSFYHDRLSLFNIEMVRKVEISAPNILANAGKKLRFNLTVEQIGCLFGLLFEFGYIKSLDDMKELQLKELASFLSDNFLSQKKGKTALSKHSLEDCLLPNKRYSAKISKLLEDLESK